MNELIIRNAGQYESTLAAPVRLRAGHAPEPEWRGVEALVVQAARGGALVPAARRKTVLLQRAPRLASAVLDAEGVLEITLNATLITDETFTLVLAVSDVTVEILSVE